MLRPAIALAAIAALTLLFAATSPAATCSVSGKERELGATYVTSVKASGTSCRSALSLVKAYHRCRRRERRRRRAVPARQGLPLLGAAHVVADAVRQRATCKGRPPGRAAVHTEHLDGLSGRPTTLRRVLWRAFPLLLCAVALLGCGDSGDGATTTATTPEKQTGPLTITRPAEDDEGPGDRRGRAADASARTSTASPTPARSSWSTAAATSTAASSTARRARTASGPRPCSSTRR